MAEVLLSRGNGVSHTGCRASSVPYSQKSIVSSLNYSYIAVNIWLSSCQLDLVKLPANNDCHNNDYYNCSISRRAEHFS